MSRSPASRSSTYDRTASRGAKESVCGAEAWRPGSTVSMEPERRRRAAPRTPGNSTYDHGRTSLLDGAFTSHIEVKAPRTAGANLAPEARPQRLDVGDVALRVVVHAALADRRQALVVAGDSRVLVAARVREKTLEVHHSGVDVVGRRVGVELLAAGQVLLDVVPGARHHLHHATRVGGRDHAVVEPALLPCDRRRERGGDAVRGGDVLDVGSRDALRSRLGGRLR